MKRKIIAGAAALTILAGGAFAVQATNKSFQDNATVDYKMEILSIEKVKEIVLERYNGKIESIELEKNRHSTFYEVEIEMDDKDVEVELDAYSGHFLYIKEEFDNNKKNNTNKSEVLKVEKTNSNDDDLDKVAITPQNETNNSPTNEGTNNKVINNNKTETEKKNVTENKTVAENKTVSQNKPAKENNANNTQQKRSNLISKEEAKNIAIAKTGGKVIEVERDSDDGRIVYEIELITANAEIEVEIDAKTGKIIDIDYDDRDDDDDDDDNDDDDRD